MGKARQSERTSARTACSTASSRPPRRRHGEQHVGDPGPDATELAFAETPRGAGCRAETQPRGHSWWLRVARHRVFVAGETGGFQAVGGCGPGQPERPEVRHQQRRIRAARDDGDAPLHERIGEATRIGQNLGCVGLERGLERFAQADRLGCDRVEDHAALHAGEDRAVQLAGERRVIGEDDAAACTAQVLVGGRRGDVGVGQGARMCAPGDQPGEVSHIGKQGGADRIGDRAEAGEVDRAGIGRAAADDELGPVLVCQALDLAHVDEARSIGAVADRVEPLAGQVRRRTVAQMAASIERHAQYRVARLEQREEDRLVGLAARMGLDVGEGAAKEQLGALDGEGLDLIGELGAAVVSRAGPAFDGFVGDDGAQGIEARTADQVLGCDQLDPVLLARELAREGRMDLRVDNAQVVEKVTRLTRRRSGHGTVMQPGQAGNRRRVAPRA